MRGRSARNVSSSALKGSPLSEYEFRTQMFPPGNDLDLHKDDIWKILELADKDFVPPLSEREPITLGEMKRARGAWSLPIEHLDFTLAMHVIIVWHNNSVVGYLSFKPDFRHETIEEYESCVLIDTVAVTPAWRRRGAARALYKTLFDSELFQSYEDAVLHTWSTNTSHGQLIESIGFEEIDRNVDERAPGIDTVIYHRKTTPNPFEAE